MMPIFQPSIHPSFNFRKCCICKNQSFPRQFRFLPKEAFRASEQTRLSVHDYYHTLFKFHKIDSETHCFHASCIDRWMEKFSYCPICKKSAENAVSSDWSSYEDEIETHEILDVSESEGIEDEPFQGLKEEEAISEPLKLPFGEKKNASFDESQEKLSSMDAISTRNEAQDQVPLLHDQKKRVWKISLKWLCVDVLCCYQKFH